MKQETKELVNWIKCQILTNQDISYKITKAATDKYQKTKESALKFLDTLPEIESHLCRGGYIQDKNGTPCCDGDKVMLVEDKHIGILTWEPDKARFYLTFTYKNTKSEAVQQIAVYKNEIEKVEE